MIKTNKETARRIKVMTSLGMSQRYIANKLKVSQYVIHLALSGFYDENMTLKQFYEKKKGKSKYFDETKHENWIA